MAQDSSNAQNNQEIDLDDIEVEIMIIAKNPKILASASAFLTRRGWPTTAFSNLGQAIELAAEKKPDFVLVSLNHQNPSIGKFIDLVKSAFNSTVIAFIENMDTASNQKLNKSSHKYKVFGQMSGPNLHRSIRRILAEQLNIGQEEKSSPEEAKSGRDQSEGTMIRGGNAADGRTIVQKNDAGATQSKGAVHIKNERSEEHAASAGEPQEVLSSGKYTMGRANRRSLKDLNGQNPNAENADPSFSPSGKEAKELAAELRESLFGADGKDGSSAEAMDDEVGISEEANAESKSKSTEQSKTASDEVGDYFNGPAPVGESSGKNLEKSAKPTAAAAAESAKNLTGLTPDQSMIERAVQSALAKIVQPGEGKVESVELIENVGVFPVDSPAMPGYLVLAWPNSEKRAEEAFFNLAQETLKNAFHEMGVPARLEKGFFVEIPRVDFPQWTNEAAFNMSLQHRDRELGVAFFSTTKPLPKALPVEGNSMYSINVDHISTERPVTFKAYLHLKKNKKFFLYLRNGRALQPEQQKRLKENNVKDFYMKSVDIENLRAFLAASYLSKTIKKAGDGGSNAA